MSELTAKEYLEAKADMCRSRMSNCDGCAFASSVCALTSDAIDNQIAAVEWWLDDSFKPKLNEGYFIIQEDGYVAYKQNYEDTYDLMAMRVGNYFRTEGAAERGKEALLKRLKGEK